MKKDQIILRRWLKNNIRTTFTLIDKSLENEEAVKDISYYECVNSYQDALNDAIACGVLKLLR